MNREASRQNVSLLYITGTDAGFDGQVNLFYRTALPFSTSLHFLILDGRIFTPRETWYDKGTKNLLKGLHLRSCCSKSRELKIIYYTELQMHSRILKMRHTAEWKVATTSFWKIIQSNVDHPI